MELTYTVPGPLSAHITVQGVTFTAVEPGTWANGITITIDGTDAERGGLVSLTDSTFTIATLNTTSPPALLTINEVVELFGMQEFVVGNSPPLTYHIVASGSGRNHVGTDSAHLAGGADCDADHRTTFHIDTGVGDLPNAPFPVFMDLPTSDPHVAGQLWAHSGVVTVSAGE